MQNTGNKYHARKITTKDGRFDSLSEYKYYLALMQDPEVVSVARQIPYPFMVNGYKIGKYIADFLVLFSDGRKEVHEVKNAYLMRAGSSTPAASLYKYKVKLMKALYGVDVKTISNASTKESKGKVKRCKAEPEQPTTNKRRKVPPAG